MISVGTELFVKYQHKINGPIRKYRIIVKELKETRCCIPLVKVHWCGWSRRWDFWTSEINLGDGFYFTFHNGKFIPKIESKYLAASLQEDNQSDSEIGSYRSCDIDCFWPSFLE